MSQLKSSLFSSLALIILLCGCSQVQAATASSAAQGLVSLSYQDLPVRQALVELAKFLEVDLLVAESVTGNLTLQLNQVPVTEVLELLLLSQGLSSWQQGRVLLVAPAAELNLWQAQQKQSQALATRLDSWAEVFLPLRYAQAKEVQRFILGAATDLVSANFALGETQDTAIKGLARMPEQGYVLADERTNSLYLRAYPQELERLQQLVAALDVPVEQVMIEARIVVARSGVSQELGVSWGVNAARSNTAETSYFDLNRSLVRGSLTSRQGLIASQGAGLHLQPGAGINFGFVSDNFLLDLELATLATENKSRVVSQPKVVTSNLSKAVIRSGEEIPYSSTNAEGERTTNFRQAELRLEVTPQLVGTDQIFLDLQVNNDSQGTTTTDAGPTINTNAVTTRVLVKDGATLVIGGIFTQQKLEGEVKLPWLGDLPWLGWLFKRTFTSQEKVELLVFVTPRRLGSVLSLN